VYNFQKKKNVFIFLEITPN